ncbi:protein ALP1-like [Coccinella septempunctata]|uniref:protein ALP1-like n=1 Tax=Coccinella septempunctata TaxID=41139 RepID=UPI001D063AE8|nr:protein ALP1-like [Coccinella septempunctata]
MVVSVFMIMRHMFNMLYTDDENAIPAAAAILILTAASIEVNQTQKRRKKRRWRVRPLFRQRQIGEHFTNLFGNMKTMDPEQFFSYLRMDRICFYKLLQLVGHRLIKRATRKTLSPEQRLVITLYFLAHGCSMQSVSWSFLVGKATVSVVVRETCQAIWDVLSPIYLKRPTMQDWKTIGNEFEEKCNLPHCCGAIDGKHIVMQAPKNSGSKFFNYKKTFSIVLMAVCDASYRFTLVDIGSFGSQSDGGVFRESAFGKALDSGSLKLPPEKSLPGSDVNFPSFFVGDEAFPLKPYLLRPYPGRNLEESKNVYNYRLSRARRTIENAFGILASRWRIFRNNIIADVTTAEVITAATIALHNFMRTEVLGSKGQMPNYIGTVDDATRIESNLSRLGRLGPNNSDRNSIEARDIMKNYLNNEGAVPWQLTYVRRKSQPNTGSS